MLECHKLGLMHTFQAKATLRKQFEWGYVSVRAVFLGFNLSGVASFCLEAFAPPVILLKPCSSGMVIPDRSVIRIQIDVPTTSVVCCWQASTSGALLCHAGAGLSSSSAFVVVSFLGMLGVFGAGQQTKTVRVTLQSTLSLSRSDLHKSSDTFACTSVHVCVRSGVVVYGQWSP